ncbi:MAG: hypothetical protein ACI4II_03050 [Acutalibacteraceae bacterium]
MDDIAGKLSQLLTDPEIMNMVKGISLSLPASDKQEEAQSNKASDTSDNIDFDFMDKIIKIMPIISSLSNDDETTRLLKALRPFLSHDKQKRLDSAITLVRLMRILPLIKEIGLF